MSILGRVARRLLGRAAPTPAAPATAVRPPPPPRSVGAPSAPTPPSDERPLEVEEPIPGSLLLDCREPAEFAGGVGAGALLLPMDMVPHHLADLPHDRPITVYCAAGSRSAGVAHWLREQGFPHAVSLSGGIGALRFGGVEVRAPTGVAPGTRMQVPATALVDGVPIGLPTDGEVIEQVGDTLRVRVFDASGYQVLVVCGVGEHLSVRRGD